MILNVNFCEQRGQLEPLLKKFTAEEEQQMKRMLQRVDILAKVSFYYHKKQGGNTPTTNKV